MKIGLLASGSLGVTAIKHLLVNFELSFIMTDINSKEIIDLTKINNISSFVGNPRGGKCKEFIQDKEIDVLISINYLYIIEQDLINLPKSIGFNIHGSLLPKYRGRTPHVWAIINNEIETGITAHVIDNGCDTGDIIDQIKFPINQSDKGADILLKFNELYIPMIDNVLFKVKNNAVNLIHQDHTKATYFGKRTPEDGIINWNWQKERIRNWVRALSFPYPGAFTFLNGKKIIVDEVEFDDLGFESSMPNGMIISKKPILVKTPNGLIRIKKLRELNIKIQTNQIFE